MNQYGEESCEQRLAVAAFEGGLRCLVDVQPRVSFRDVRRSPSTPDATLTLSSDVPGLDDHPAMADRGEERVTTSSSSTQHATAQAGSSANAAANRSTAVHMWITSFLGVRAAPITRRTSKLSNRRVTVARLSRPMEGSATRNADHREGLTVHLTVHTAPVRDLVSHDTDIGLTMLTRFSSYDVCACGPDITIYPSGGIAVTHHSLDGREHTEPKRRLFRRRRNSSPGWISKQVHHP